MDGTRPRGVGVLLLGVSVACVYLAGRPGVFPSPPASPLLLEPSSLELGELFQGDVRDVALRLTNRGREPLRVVDVLAGCDCTTAEVPKVTLEPGAHVAVPVTWEIGMRRGRVRSSLTVLVADVIPDVEYRPSVLVFEAGGRLEQWVEFSPGRLDDFELGKPYCTQRAFSGALFPDSRRVVVTFDPAQWAEDLRTAVLIVPTSSAVEPQCRIPLVVRGATGVAPMRGSVSFFESQETERLRRRPVA